MIIAVDFDGTCVTHEYPGIGEDIGAVPVLKDLVAQGHDLILWTMRSGDSLVQACKWFDAQEIHLFGINNNPQQATWTSSPKAYAHCYIDDAALGCPLVYPEGKRPHVNWTKMRHLLMTHGYLKRF